MTRSTSTVFLVFNPINLQTFACYRPLRASNKVKNVVDSFVKVVPFQQMLKKVEIKVFAIFCLFRKGFKLTLEAQCLL